MNKFLFSLFLLSLIPQTSFAWKSALPSTHLRISDRAISLISSSQYPDVTTKYGSHISDWSSGLRDDKAAHGRYDDSEIDFVGRSDALDFNGGPFRIWWESAVQTKYKRFYFASSDQSAYYYVGLMAHLVEDQVSPAHSANISHGGLSGDALENWSWSLTPTTNQTKDLGVDPHLYYFRQIVSQKFGSIPETQSHLTSWTYPQSGHIMSYLGLQYWKEHPTIKYVGTEFDANWGTYGGPNATDPDLRGRKARYTGPFGGGGGWPGFDGQCKGGR